MIVFDGMKVNFTVRLKIKVMFKVRILFGFMVRVTDRVKVRILFRIIARFTLSLGGCADGYISGVST